MLLFAAVLGFSENAASNTIQNNNNFYLSALKNSQGHSINNHFCCSQWLLVPKSRFLFRSVYEAK